MLGIFWIVLASFLWATDALIRYPLTGSGLSATTIVFYEHLFLTLIFLPFLFKHRERFFKTTISEIFYFLIIGGIGSAFSTIAFTKAFTLINPSLVILLQKFQPIVAILLARVVLGETLNNKFIFWAGICIVGAVLISYRDLMIAFSGDLFSSTAFMGYGLVAFSVIGWGASTVFGKKLSENYTHQELMCGRFLTAFVCILPLLSSPEAKLNIDMLSIGKIALMVLLSGLLAMFFYYKGLKKISAKTCALAELFFPFAAVLINWIFLGQSLTELQLAGGALLLIGSSIVQINHY